MKKSLVIAVSAIACALALSTAAAFAHHSSAGLFSVNVNKTLKGTVQKWLYVNPHVALVIDVPDEKGAVETWRVEFTSPNGLKSCCNLGRTSFRAGDKVTIYGHPYLNDIKTMDAVKVTLADGKELVVRDVNTPEYEGNGK